MRPLPLILAGVPPFGLGAFDRGHEGVPGAPFRFRSIHAANVNTAGDFALAARLGPVWMHLLPRRFDPDTWRDGLRDLLRRANIHGPTGIIVNPEWAGADDGAARAFGREVKAASADFRVGMVSIPSFPSLRAFADACDGGCWGSYEAYHRTRAGADVFASWHAAWERAFGRGRVIPSIAAWYPETPLGQQLRDPDTYRRYIASLPKAAGAIAWTTSNAPPRHMLETLSTYEPGGSLPGTVALACASLAVSRAGIGALAMLALVMVIVTLRIGAV